MKKNKGKSKQKPEIDEKPKVNPKCLKCEHWSQSLAKCTFKGCCVNEPFIIPRPVRPIRGKVQDKLSVPDKKSINDCYECGETRDELLTIDDSFIARIICEKCLRKLKRKSKSRKTIISQRVTI